MGNVDAVVPVNWVPLYSEAGQGVGVLGCYQLQCACRAGQGVQSVQRDTGPAEQGSESGSHCPQGQAHAPGTGGPEAASCCRHGRLRGEPLLPCSACPCRPVGAPVQSCENA